MIDMNGIAAAIGVPCTISGIMQEHLQLWETLYCNQSEGAFPANSGGRIQRIETADTDRI